MEAGAGAEVGTTDPAATVDATAAVALEGEVNRNYTVGAGKLTANAELQILNISFSDGMGNSASFSRQGLSLGAGYGVTDKITAGGAYTFPVAGDGVSDQGATGKGELSIFGMFNIVDSAKMKVSAGAEFSVDMCGKAGDDGKCAVGGKGINAGLGLKYLVAPKVAIWTGAPYGPVFFGGNPGQHLSISLEDDGAINFDVPVGVGLQAIPKLYAYAGVNLATFRLKKPDGADGIDTVSPIGSDTKEGGIGVPFIVGGLFNATPQIDAGVNLIFPDLMNAGDAYAITLGGRYNM